jgi:hypothetical protein
MTSIELHLDPSALRQWHLDLATSLTERTEPTVVFVRWAEAAAGRRPHADRLFAVERVLHGLGRGGSTRVTAARFSGFGPAQSTPDLCLDLAGMATGPASRLWRLEFDGAAGDRAAVAALLTGRFPVVSLVTPDGQLVAAGRPGSDSPGVLTAAYDDLLAGSIQLVLAALDDRGPVLPGGHPPTVGRAGPRSPGAIALRAIASSAAHRVYRGLYRAPHWRVGWRFVEGEDVMHRGELPPSDWNLLPDDGYHFYADPFPFTRGGATWLFVEDFDHRLGRGVISVVDFDQAGPVGSPRPVLEHEVHLSYPLVLEDEGELWMIPETSAAGTVELYRANRFPDAWTREAVLLRDVIASDVTCFRHDDRWWMTATVRHGGSYSDALHVWHADRLQGPWHPHRNNPVLIDISSARPAGHVVRRDGRLLRPAQDGTQGYGSALALAEIERLDETSFRQRVVARLAPGERWPGHRLHTLNRAGRLECIDGSALSPRYRRSRSATTSGRSRS